LSYERLEMNMWIRHVLSATTCLLLLAACSPAGTASPASSTTGVAPFHSIPSNSKVVWGTATCELSDGGVDPVGGGAGWLAVCDFDMSDPRVSGTETEDRFRFVIGAAGIATLWVSEEATISNAEGTWRGSVQGAEDSGSSPIGEAHYVGEGAYQGLEFHYYFAAVADVPIQVHGWISSSE
jgi:hypothetical protein